MYTSTIISSFFLTTTLASPLQTRQCTGPNVNAATVALIKEFEGFVASPAPDPIGLPTVGYGHLCQTSGCSEVPYSFPLTTSTASQLLNSDLKVCIYRSHFSTPNLTNVFEGSSANHNPAHHLRRHSQRKPIRRPRVLDIQCRSCERGVLDTAQAA